MSGPVVALLHPGQMGAAVAAQARRNQARVLWCPQGRSPASQARAQAAGLEPVATVADLCRQADVLLSICPPAAAEGVAEDVARHGFTRVYVEANAISPARFTRIAQSMPIASEVADGGIIGPPPKEGVETTLYLACTPTSAQVIEGVFAGTWVRVVHLPQAAPAASALKMAYAAYQKASRALAAVSFALADRYDVTAPLLDEAARNSRSPLTDPEYVPSVAARAWRWAPEMRDVADTLNDARLPADLALAAAAVLERWEHDKDDTELTTVQALQHLTVTTAHQASMSHRVQPETPAVKRWS